MRHICLVALALTLLAAARAGAAEPDTCRTVRFGDIGWTDTEATTALARLLLRDLGYQTSVLVQSVPMVLRSLHDGKTDVFLGDYEPPMAPDSRRYLADASLEVLATNLKGARYSLAVPHYLYQRGLRDFADIRKFGPALDWSIHGIEPGNDGNRFVQTLIRQDRFGLGRFHLVEDTQMDMLTDVDTAYRAGKPIVFIAWAPHPMNTQYRIDYLTGGDDTFGPNFGGAEVRTLARAGFAAACPNAARLLRNLVFDLAGEEAMMDLILTTKLAPDRAAAAWLHGHKTALRRWLDGVTTADGKPAATVVAAGR